MKPTKQNRKKEPSDIDHRLIDLRRVARVVAGGRRFSFRAAVVAGQVDRLAVAADRVSVLDYKTHRPPPEAESDVPEIYLRQMALYRALLARAFPGRAVTCALLWTDGPRIMELSDGILDRFAPEL